MLEQIRPAHLVKEQERLRTRDRIALRQDKKQFVNVPCPACGRGNNDLLWAKGGFTYDKCLNCSTVYMTPRPTAKRLAQYLQESKAYHYWAKELFPATEKARYEQIALPRAQQVVRKWQRADFDNHWRKKPKSLLDIGAGHGTFCRAMQKVSPATTLFAIEPVTELANACRQLGVGTFYNTVEEQEGFVIPFAIITAWEVIEHVFSPYNVLAKCHAWLKPKGLLFLTCPNIQSLEVMLLKQESSIVTHDHLSYFNPNSLRMLLNRAGFETLQITTPGQLDAEVIRQAYLDRNIPARKVGLLSRHVLIDHWDTLGDSFQKWLADIGLSSHMQAIAQRKG